MVFRENYGVREVKSKVPKDNSVSLKYNNNFINLTNNNFHRRRHHHHHRRHHHHHHHHISFMELGYLLIRSGLTYPEVSSKVYHDSFCQ